MTITVPVALKREMEKHGEINWSRVATKAFEKQVEAEKVLAAFAEPGISEKEAIQRALGLRHKLLESEPVLDLLRNPSNGRRRMREK